MYALHKVIISYANVRILHKLAMHVCPYAAYMLSRLCNDMNNYLSVG